MKVQPSQIYNSLVNYSRSSLSISSFFKEVNSLVGSSKPCRDQLDAILWVLLFRSDRLESSSGKLRVKYPNFTLPLSSNSFYQNSFGRINQIRRKTPLKRLVLPFLYFNKTYYGYFANQHGVYHWYHIISNSSYQPESIGLTDLIKEDVNFDYDLFKRSIQSTEAGNLEEFLFGYGNSYTCKRQCSHKESTLLQLMSSCYTFTEFGPWIHLPYPKKRLIF